MKPLKRSVSITLDEETIDDVKHLAEDADRSFSQYINIVLRRHVEAVQKKRTPRLPPRE